MSGAPRMVWVAVCPKCGPVWASTEKRRLSDQECADHVPSPKMTVHRYVLRRARRNAKRGGG